MKDSYKINQLERAVEDLLRWKFVDGRSGYLTLEINDANTELTFGQYPSSNSWTQGWTTIWSISDHETISDFNNQFSHIENDHVILNPLYDIEMDFEYDIENGIVFKENGEWLMNVKDAIDFIDTNEIAEEIKDNFAEEFE